MRTATVVKEERLGNQSDDDVLGDTYSKSNVTAEKYSKRQEDIPAADNRKLSVVSCCTIYLSVPVKKKEDRLTPPARCTDDEQNPTHRVMEKAEMH